jgi:hypothetical protein
VSFIGSLDQFDLTIILQKIEEYHKTGLLVVKQDDRSVELSFRHGQFLCIGPVRSQVSLGERLLQAGIISQEARQSVEVTLGEKRFSETEAALAFLNAGYVDKQSLMRWAAIEAALVLEALLSWQQGDIYFEADAPLPSQRLLIALSITSLLSAMPATSALSPAWPVQPEQAEQHPGAVAPEPHLSTGAILSGVEMPVSGERDTDSITKLGERSSQTIRTPQRVTGQIAPIRVNIAMMQPDMTLTPADLSTKRESDQSVCLTPDQWRLMTRADGQTTLLMATHELGMSRNQVCQAAGELAEMGLVTLSQTGAPIVYAPANYLNAPVPFPGAQADVIRMSRAAYPVPSYITPPSISAFQRGQVPIETDSQWGNGGNGATFVLGNGWVVAPPPAPVQQREVEAQRNDRVYAKAG